MKINIKNGKRIIEKELNCYRRRILLDYDNTKNNSRNTKRKPNLKTKTYEFQNHKSLQNKKLRPTMTGKNRTELKK